MGYNPIGDDETSAKRVQSKCNVCVCAIACEASYPATNGLAVWPPQLRKPGDDPDCGKRRDQDLLQGLSHYMLLSCLSWASMTFAIN